MKYSVLKSGILKTDKDAFYDYLRELTLNIKPHTVTILADDFNARIGAGGYKTNPRTVGPVFLYSKSNDNVSRFIDGARPPI